MEKEKSVRKKSSEKCAQPFPDSIFDQSDAFKRIAGYKERETAFLKTLKDTIDMEAQCNSDKKRKHSTGSGPSSSTADDSSFSADMLNDECDKYLLPLIQRTGPSISAAISTAGAIDQLDKLHGILEHLLHMQEQNYRLRRSTRDVDTLTGLKRMHEQINKDSDSFMAGNSTLTDPYSDMELEYNEALLETILAAGNSASNKRNSSKRNRLRSKSVFTDDILSMPDKENKSYTLRRQSAVGSDIKAKVSKWTKVKAAFKWERANVSSMNEGKSTDSGIGLSPINNEVARYLRVPSIPCTGSSADSVLSSSSGHLLSGSSVPPTPGTMSSASSVEDVGAISEEFRHHRDSSKSESRSESRATHDEDARRSRSLDGEATLCSSVTRHLDKQSKNKTPWRKVKDIIQTHRGSLKGKSRSRSVKSNNSLGCSRDASPSDSIDAFPTTEASFLVNPESCSSSQTSPIRKNCPTLMLTAPGVDSNFGPNSPSSPLPNFVRPENESRQKTGALSRSSRKGKILLDICSLPEGAPIESMNMPARGKPPPSPLNLSSRQDSSDAEPNDHSNSPVLSHKPFKWSKVRKPFATINSSAPNSPVQQLEFFGGFDSEELSSGDFSEPNTPHLHLSPKNSLTLQQDEINRKYQELQQQISLEFQAKQKEWERIRTSSVAVSCPVPCLQNDLNKDCKGGAISKPIEENLTPDFKKKLQEWRIKQQSITTNVSKDSQSSPTKEGDGKKIDWNLWKTGLLKLEGQGLKPLPDEKNLPEDFQKKLDEWKRIKSGGTSLSAVGDVNVKRQSWKSSQARKFESTKKLKSDDFERERQRIERDRSKFMEKEKLEKLSKLKAMVAEPPTKEVVVQTSEGVLKFEGISRKFTRKLYEWEKARGIGPEASTFALLHPGYRPLLVGDGDGDNGDENKGSPIARSLSMDSVSPNPSATSISHQPSSLSLNNVDDLKDTNSINDRLSSSNPELDVTDEPEAVIVEVEDDYVETAAPLLAATPMIEEQTPVYRYEQTRKEFCAGNKEPVFVGDKCSKNSQSTSRALQDATQLVSTFHDVKHGFKENILHVKTVLDSLLKTLPKLKENLAYNSTALLDSVELVKDLAVDINKKLTALEESEGSKDELDERMAAIDNQLIALRKTLNFLCKHTDSKPAKPETVPPDINIIPDDVEKSVATVSVCLPPAAFHGEVIVNQVQVMDDRSMHNDDSNFASQRLPDSPTGSRAPISEQDAKRITKTLSNGSKRKTKLRRLGSRQNSKTESDSDEGMQNVVLDAPRRVKRKTSRAKKVSEPDKVADESNPNDDVVYVLKIKPSLKIEPAELQLDDVAVPVSPDANVCLSANNVFVKTKRKIFTPVEDTHNNIEAVIVRDIETSSGSDRNESDTKCVDTPVCPVESDKLVTNLPPIPQSPGMQRRLDKSKTINQKEPSSAIRFMIAKYERRNSTGTGTGSSSPTAWRSPLMERRIRVQTEKYMGQITKSSSAGNVRKENNRKASLNSNFEVERHVKGVLKSSSAGVLNDSNKMFSTSSVNTSMCRDSLACDSLENIHSTLKKLPSDIGLCVDDKRLGFYKKNVDSTGVVRMSASTGAVRKIVTKQVHEDDQCKNEENNDIPLDKSVNTVPKIKRKNEGKPPSPRSQHRPIKAYLELNSRNTSPAVRESSSSSQIAHLSDRALKLKKAKDEFLNLNRHCYCPGEEIWKNRLSQISAGSESSNDDCALVKSASVGVMDKDLKKNMGFVSLPRNANRSTNSPATVEKFGLSTIASKFRKVKLRKNSKDLPAMKTVTELCRQILEVDISKQRKSDDSPNVSNTKTNRTNDEKISKSGSANTLGLSTIFRRLDRSEKLKKSKSIGQLEMDDKE
ncbi:uncharacterized protein LOC119067416 isoform X2 [Bradysia coprophila]|uniref:uncharacterized protein LOC119067416 isoform X2 n=1 Tax=Bradysia coprophila TaxID=38358 RepID=UPI00187DC2E5|nr:uncharacterized protein LOC119067416 isoform X2 [Bradysia coprophila]